MKKTMRLFAGFMAASFIALTTAVSGFAAVQRSFNVKGAIDSKDLKIYVSIPTAGSTTTVIKVKNQKDQNEGKIITTAQAFENTSINTDDPISYDVTFIGYTLTASDDISVQAYADRVTDYIGTAKRAYVAIQMAAASATDPTVDSDEGFAARFNNPLLNVIARRTENDYSTGSVDYRRISAAPVTMKAGEYIPMRITGMVNPKAEWTADEIIRVTPVFKIKPNMKVK